MAVMRYQGRLKKWNAERGYGFIVSTDSGQDIFVHTTAFPRDGCVPMQGDEVTFEVEPDGKGKKQAVRVQRLGAAQPAAAPAFRPSARPMSRTPRKSSVASKLGALVLLAVVGWYGYSRYESRVAQIKAVDASPAPAALFEPAQSASSTFNCDGRKRCSQMTSCQEAKLFLKNCPGMEIDGDNDGVPCEEQWCN